jgi:hypothetical protein
MFLSIFKTRVRLHARRVFDQVLGGTYDGEVFLCGGAFKPLLKRKAPINHLDLWVRDRKERENLTRFLLARGAVLARESHPYCLKLRLDGRLIEISYHNVKDGELADVLNTFDLAICGIGARYKWGRVLEVHVAEECWGSVRRRTVQVLSSYLCAVQELRAPCIIRTLHRMGQEASELDFDVDVAHEHLLWDTFWNQFSEEERRAAMELYFETTVSFKGTAEDRLLRRAMSGYVPPVPASAGHPHSLMTPQRA